MHAARRYRGILRCHLFDLGFKIRNFHIQINYLRLQYANLRLKASDQCVHKSRNGGVLLVSISVGIGRWDDVGVDTITRVVSQMPLPCLDQFLHFVGSTRERLSASLQN
jgi:hypothetical protein